MNIYLKIIHWSMVLSFLFLAVTGLFGVTIYSVGGIVPNLEFAFAVSEIHSGMAAKVAVAKVIRGLMWEWHYYVGLLSSGLFFIWIFLKNKTYNFKKNPFPVIFLVLTLILLISGVIRYYRGDLSFTTEQDKTWRTFFQLVHFYTSILFGIFVIGHIVHVIRKNIKDKSLISDMFRKTKFHLRVIPIVMLLVVFNSQSYSKDFYNKIIDQKVMEIVKIIGKKQDKHFKEGMQFYSGKKGFHLEERDVPNCPYEACRVKNDEIEADARKLDGTTVYKIKIHNFKEAMKFFNKSVDEYQNPLAAEKNLIMILERLNYKDKYYDEFLLAHTKKSLGLNSIKEINKAVLKNTRLININNSQKILFKVAEIYEKGYFGQKKCCRQAYKYYKYASLKNKKSFYGILAKNKMKELKAKHDKKKFH